MIRHFTFLLFLFAGILLRAQTDNVNLAGSWKYEGYEMHGKFFPSGGVEILSFYPDSTYRDSIVWIRGDSVQKRIEAGKWSVNEMLLTRSQLHEIPERTSYMANDRSETISSFSDTVMILAGYEGKTPLYMHYRRIPTATEIPDPHQYHVPKPKRENPTRLVYRYYLVNSGDTSKKFELKKDNAITFYLEENFNRDTADAVTHYYIGFIDTLNDSVITIRATEETIVVYYKNGDSHERYISYDHDAKKTIRVDQIRSITYRGPLREKWNSFGAGVAYVSLVDALEFAPLISLDFRGGFKVKRYFILAGIGVAGMAAGALIASLSMEKKYRLTQGKFSDRKHWRIVQGDTPYPEAIRLRRIYR